MSGHVISQGILNLINPGFTNEKMEEPSELVFASFNQGTGQIIWKEKTCEKWNESSISWNVLKKHFFQINFEILLSDTTSLAVGTTSGYKLYSLTSTDSLDPIYANGRIPNL